MEKSSRLDVIEWAVEEPYAFWWETLDEEGMVLAEKSSEAVKYKINSEETVLVKENDIGCMKE